MSAGRGAIPDSPHHAAAEATKRYFHGTHRVCAPEDTIARLQPLLREVGITRVANVTGLDRTGIPVVMVCRPNARSVTVSQGKGLTLAAAKASGIMEALEVWHAERIVRPLKLASFEEMRSEHPVADIAKLPRARESPFTPQLPLPWIEGHDLLSHAPMWLPFELVSTNYTLPLPPGSGCFQANTNGLASGNHWLEAVCHGLCEVVERDATTLWKHMSAGAQEGRMMVDPSSVDDAACQEVIGRFDAAQLELRIWDTTTDLGVASFVCLLMGRSSDNADPEFGAGCHPVRSIALLRALTEAAQARNTYIAGARDDYPAHAYEPGFRRRRMLFCLQLAAARPRRAFPHVPSFESSSAQADLQWMLARLRAAGIDQAIAVDLTRDAIGMPVARVVVPGLEGPMDEADGDYSPGRRARRMSRSDA